MSQFVIAQKDNGKFYFSFIMENEQLLLEGKEYVTRQCCMNAILSSKLSAKISSRFEKGTSPDGKSYYVLKASNGRDIVTSKMFESEAERDEEIAFISYSAPASKIIDLTLAERSSEK